MKEQRTLEQVLAGDIPQVEFEMTAEDFGEWLTRRRSGYALLTAKRLDASRPSSRLKLSPIENR